VKATPATLPEATVTAWLEGLNVTALLVGVIV
jgi:hypothetical protein